MANSVNRMYFVSKLGHSTSDSAQRTTGVTNGRICKDGDADDHENQRPHREWRKDEAERDYGTEIVDKAGRQDALPKVGFIEAQFQHDGIDHGDGSGRKCDASEPTGWNGPMEHSSAPRRLLRGMARRSRRGPRRKPLSIWFEKYRGRARRRPRMLGRWLRFRPETRSRRKLRRELRFRSKLR